MELKEQQDQLVQVGQLVYQGQLVELVPLDLLDL